MTILDDLTALLLAFVEDPWIYSAIFFLFVVAATVILPIPEEIGLLNPFLPFWLLVVILALAKGVGALIVYPIGGAAGDQIRRWSSRWPWFDRGYLRVETWVGRYGYWALFGLLAIPFMTDTVPVYAFAALNPRAHEGEPDGGSGTPGRSAAGARATDATPIPDRRRRFRPLPFVVVNILAGAVRGLLFLSIPLVLGWP